MLQFSEQGGAVCWFRGSSMKSPMTSFPSGCLAGCPPLFLTVSPGFLSGSGCLGCCCPSFLLPCSLLRVLVLPPFLPPSLECLEFHAGCLACRVEAKPLLPSLPPRFSIEIHEDCQGMDQALMRAVAGVARGCWRGWRAGCG